MDARQRGLNSILVPVSLLAALAFWSALSAWGDFPTFILPTPSQVGSRFLETIRDGSLVRHTLVTLQEVVSGLALGLSCALVLGYLLAKSERLERLLSPYIIASQAIPMVAMAPLLIIWLGPGVISKVLITALIVFFPILVNIMVGIRSVPRELYDLMRSYQASPWQTLRYLEVPATMPVFLGGLRIGATLAVIGAVVGEFVGADRGLGFLVNLGRGLYDTALVFVSIFTLIVMALTLYGLVRWLEIKALGWRKSPGSRTHS